MSARHAGVTTLTQDSCAAEGVSTNACTPPTPPVTSCVTPEERRKLELAYVTHHLAKGKGDSRQQEAYQELEWRKCAASFTYFIDRYGMIFDKETQSVEKWHMWPVQRELSERFEAKESIVAVKCRQIAVTTLTSHFAMWEVIFKNAARWYIVSADEDAAKDALERFQATVRHIEEAAPWMLARARQRATAEDKVVARKDKQDATTVFSCGLSFVRILTSSGRKPQGKAGNFILDEFSQHDNQSTIYRHAKAATDGGGQLIIIANGNGEDEFYHVYQRSKDGLTGMTALFFDWQSDPRRDEGWYQRTLQSFIINNAESDEFEFKQQYPSNEHEAFYLTGNSRFSQRVVNWHAQKRHEAEIQPDIGYLQKTKEGFEFVHRGTDNLRIWEAPQAGASYILGCDPAGGNTDSDYSVVEVCKVVNGEKLEQVAEYRAKIEPTLMSLRVEQIARWYNDGFIVVERNNHGHTVLSHLKTHYFCLYQYTDYSTKMADEFGDNLGYPQNARTKTEMIDELAMLLDIGTDEYPKEPKILLRSDVSLRELSIYERNKVTKKLGAPKGQNDDTVAGLGLCAVGLRDYYASAYGGKDFDPMEW